MATSLVCALGGALILTTTVENRIAGHYRLAAQARYAADAAIARVLPELARLASWDALLDGTARSTFTDGAPAGVRQLPGGLSFNLAEATNDLRCGAPLCNDATLVAVSEERPWRRNNPLWQPIAYGSLDRMIGVGAGASTMYVVVWIGDDPAENDDDPRRDGGVPVGCDPMTDPDCVHRNPGRDTIMLQARAIGPTGTERRIEVTIRRTDRVRVLSWRELR